MEASASPVTVAGQTVRDIMRAEPKTLPSSATVGDLRSTFANPNVVMALVVDEHGALVGVVDRDALTGTTLTEEAPATSLVRREVDSIQAQAPASEVWEHADVTRTGRLVVLEPDGRTLAGLVCVRKDGSTFCQ